ncbi:MAG: hypothetical protein Q4G24_16540 [Paracoccus sp. (in: a-proteobacteria)]|nr:hypothetical protein [Paracoccus sp. (in: a-proteobacteria)]MDO5623045.1 hypothetical protein [Paracoccus sp. (in: a-proteobacteria)]
MICIRPQLLVNRPDRVDFAGYNPARQFGHPYDATMLEANPLHQRGIEAVFRLRLADDQDVDLIVECRVRVADRFKRIIDVLATCLRGNLEGALGGAGGIAEIESGRVATDLVEIHAVRRIDEVEQLLEKIFKDAVDVGKSELAACAHTARDCVEIVDNRADEGSACSYESKFPRL